MPLHKQAVLSLLVLVLLPLGLSHAISLSDLLPQHVESNDSLRPPNEEELHSLEKEVAQGVHCLEPNACEIDRSLFEKTKQTSEQLGQYLRLAPFFAKGHLQGLRLYSMLPSSLLAKLRLKEGDIFRSINGFDFTHPLTALGGYVGLQLASDFQVVIERNGKILHLSYTVH